MTMPYTYNWTQWLFLFYFYSFVGWIWETSFCSIKNRKFENRGFMRGPFLPIYGFGVITMMLSTCMFRGNLPLVFISGMIGATILEYFTGALMEALFKVRYWDYSDKPLNLNGHICLFSSLGWGLASIIVDRLLEGPADIMVSRIPERGLVIMTDVLTMIIFADFALSFKAAIDLRHILESMERARENVLREMAEARDDAREMISNVAEKAADSIEKAKDNALREASNYRKRMDVVAAVADDEAHKRKEEITAKLDKWKKDMEEKFPVRDYFIRGQIYSNNVVSRKYAESLKELSDRITSVIPEKLRNKHGEDE